MDIRSILNRLDYLTEEIAPRNGAWLGDNIGKIQQGLEDLGYSVGSKGVDSNFGPDSAAAVRAFQQANPPLVVDGDPGPETVAVMNKLLAEPGRKKPDAAGTPAADPAAQKNPEDAKKLDELAAALEKLVPIDVINPGSVSGAAKLGSAGLKSVAALAKYAPEASLLAKTMPKIGKFGTALTGIGSVADAVSAYQNFQAGNNIQGSLDVAAAMLNMMGISGKIASGIITGGKEYYLARNGEYGSAAQAFVKDPNFGISSLVDKGKELVSKANRALTTESIEHYQHRLDLIEMQQLDEGAWDAVKGFAAKIGKAPNWVLNTGMIMYEAYHESKDLPKPVNPNDAGQVARYKSKLAKIWSKVIAEFGIFTVGAYFGALIGAPFGGIPGMLVGLLGGMAGGLALQHAFGDKPEELINYIIDEIYPEGSSENPVDSSGKISSTGTTTGTSVPAVTNKPAAKPTQYADPDKESRYQNWLKTQQGAF